MPNIPAPYLWEIGIRGDVEGLRDLSKSFRDPQLTVVEVPSDSSFLLRSSRFDLCAGAREVCEAATELITIITGVLRVVRQFGERIVVTAVYRTASDGSREIIAVTNEAIELHDSHDATIHTAEGSVWRALVPATPRTLLLARLALRDVPTYKALRLLAAPDAQTWVGLYRLLELIAEDVGGERAIVRHGWGSASQWKRFKHSANSPSIAGDASRHAREPGKPPSHPMGYDEARAYTNYVISAWLHYKGAHE